MKIRTTIQVLIECEGADLKACKHALHDMRFELGQCTNAIGDAKAKGITTYWTGDYEEVDDDD